MKIGAISTFGLNRNRPLTNAENNKPQTANFGMPFNNNYDCNIPFYPILNKPITSSNVSFGINIPFKTGRCCCCRIKMIDDSKFHLPRQNFLLSPEHIIEKIKKMNLTEKEAETLEILEKINKVDPQVSFDKLLKNIKNPPPLFAKFKRRYINLPNQIHTKNTIDYLNKFEESMHETEKEVFKKIKETNAINPKKTIRELLLAMRPEHLKNLQAKQLEILKNIDLMANDLSPESSTSIKTFIQEEKRWITKKNDDEDPFKRKKFIKFLTELTTTFPESDKDIAANIIKNASFIPSSQDDVSAFIVKYSGLRKKKNSEKRLPRSSTEIATRLVSGSFASIEHIVAQNALDGRKGQSIQKNLVWMCRADNSKRGNTPYPIFLKDSHPEMIKNLQKTADDWIEDINSGKVTGADEYPAEIAQTYYEETNGLINLDISALKTTSKNNQLNQTNPQSSASNRPESQGKVLKPGSVLNV